jgi:hypothetical protein
MVLKGSTPGGSTPYAGLASGVNQFMTGQAAAPYIANLPGYQAMTGQQSQNILSQLKGEVPQDVINQVLQQAAERGIATGTAGGPNANAAYMKMLGLTSLGLQQQGAQNLTQAIANTPVPELFNPMSLYVPEKLAGLSLGAAQSGVNMGAVNMGAPSAITTRAQWEAAGMPGASGVWQGSKATNTPGFQTYNFTPGPTIPGYGGAQSQSQYYQQQKAKADAANAAAQAQTNSWQNAWLAAHQGKPSAMQQAQALENEAIKMKNFNFWQGP